MNAKKAKLLRKFSQTTGISLNTVKRTYLRDNAKVRFIDTQEANAIIQQFTKRKEGTNEQHNDR